MPSSKDEFEAYKDLTYLSQAVHAHCLSLSSAHYRLQRGSASATMGLMFWSLNNQWQGQSDAAVDYTGRWKLLQYAMKQVYAPVLLALHSGWDTEVHTGWDDTNITAGIANDTPASANATVTMSLRSWATGDALQSWTTTSIIPAYSSRNFTKLHKAAILGRHVESKVFLTATAAVHGDDAATMDGLAQQQAHHYFTKMKAAELQDPQINLVVGEEGGNLSVTLSAKAPAPNVFVDPGMLLGHFDHNGLLLLPGTPHTLIFDAMGELNVTVERLQAEVVVRSPWSTQHHQ